MEKKISPQEYSRIVNSIELESIELLNASLKNDQEYFVDKNVHVNIKDKIKHETNDGKITFNQSYVFTGKGEDVEKPLVTIKAEYKIVFFVVDNIVIPESFIEIFKKVNLTLTVWPYFREFVQSSILRMGLPPFTLPLRRT